MAPFPLQTLSATMPELSTDYKDIRADLSERVNSTFVQQKLVCPGVVLPMKYIQTTSIPFFPLFVLVFGILVPFGLLAFGILVPFGLPAFGLCVPVRFGSVFAAGC